MTSHCLFPMGFLSDSCTPDLIFSPRWLCREDGKMRIMRSSRKWLVGGSWGPMRGRGQAKRRPKPHPVDLLDLDLISASAGSHLGSIGVTLSSYLWFLIERLGYTHFVGFLNRSP
ncbi:hypothetical protein SODALDRAFT_354800 [Sodiomyces alkalinus F11]|uniref:Uncharacterized protein n=1 Tax=Sodiomyces alkalinus (strain CBS 110278 / VKM F-3762 / F11) TaxID=1314773 RepID=A0A3N2Q7J7_SODAK|nr:hypothetical protein SODALDRAFT_354800 [Sodiomyces alkalinus F11]ROT42638.1 hypothetical protein SODALDRAFT_354800 [Sodiomyces alkalinus F11]